ncbi:hypothetical protein VSU19_08065 [Verrucomicrobiales bacterium BCK34]|nr:hypothetical protein [Verrucomicrobiales bacterium BCK34]
MDQDKKDQPAPPELPEKTKVDAEVETEETEPAIKLEPMGNAITLQDTIDAILKSPGQLIFELREGRSNTVAKHLTIISVVAMLVFGFVLGLFSGGEQLWAAPLKLLAGMTISVLITLPSLYVFSCLSGIDMTPQKAGGMLLAGVALLSLVLLAMCPVSWIFTQSTNSVGAMGFFTLLFWVVAISFGLSRIYLFAKISGLIRQQYLLVWVTIFIVVTLQMSTSLRPLIGPAEGTFLPTEKRFFLEHWAMVLGE